MHIDIFIKKIITQLLNLESKDDQLLINDKYKNSYTLKLFSR